MGLFSALGGIAGAALGSIVPGFGTALGASIGGGLGGALDSSKSKKTNNAAQQQVTAAQNLGINNALASNNAGLGVSQNQFAPYQIAGQQALGQQGDLLGLNGATQQQSSIDALKASPLYQSLFGNGLGAAAAMQSATGGLRGGNAQQAFANFGTDTLARVIQQQLSGLGGMAGQGLNATTQIGGLRNNNSAINAQLLTDQGNANAQGIYNQNVNNQTANNNIGSALGGIDIASLLSSLGMGGGGVSAPQFDWGKIGQMSGSGKLF